MTPPIPSTVSDPRRLAALDGYAILDTAAERGFDDIVKLACRLCAVPVALVSLVGGDRQWFKARAGFPACETDLGHSICVHALARPDALLVIPDLAADPRTRDNPLVTGAPFIRFYAGAPLVTPEGHVLGSLCVIDGKPRRDGLTRAQAEDLEALARQVMSQLELRRALANRDQARTVESNLHRVREVLRGAQDAVAAADGDLGLVFDAVLDATLEAIPAADGGAVEIIRGADLEYRGAQGSLAAFAGLRVPIRGSIGGECVRRRAALRMADAASDPFVNRDLAGRTGMRSAILVPLLRGDAVLGVIKLQSRRADAFTDADMQVLRLFAGAAAAELAEAAARTELRAKDGYWRGLFDRLHEGFVVGEVVRDEGGFITDWRYVEVNPAWGALLGIEPAGVLGRTVREVFPELENEWISDFAEVVESGHPANFTRQIGTLRRWYEGRTFRLDADRFGVIFLEVTARVEAEARRAALLAIGDRLRDLGTVAEMTAAAAEIVGRTLGGIRAGFGRISGDVEFVDIEPDWTAPGTASIAGHHRIDHYGDLGGPLRCGEPTVIGDVDTDPRTRTNLLSMRDLGIRSMVNMPVRERGRTVAIFFVHCRETRDWTAEDLAFLRNVADRVEVGVARVCAEDLQTVLNDELAHRLKNTLAIVQTIARQTLRNVEDREVVDDFERRLLALSRAHDVLLQKSWTAAQMRAVMESVLTMQSDLDRFAFEGPDMDVSAQAALSLSMLLHELATNALKYGALSAEGGTVRIAWRIEDGRAPEAALVLDWIERGGPAVTAPSGRGGFGSTIIRMGLMGTRKSELRYDAPGLRAEFKVPLLKMQVQAH